MDIKTGDAVRIRTSGNSPFGGHYGVVATTIPDHQNAKNVGVIFEDESVRTSDESRIEYFAPDELVLLAKRRQAV